MTGARLLIRLARIAAVAGAVHLATGAVAYAQRPRRPTPPAHDQSKADDNDEAAPAPRTEPDLPPPADPLIVPAEMRPKIGSDWTGGSPSAVGTVSQTMLLPYEERQGDYRLRLLPPVLIERTRGLKNASQSLYGVPKSEDTEGLYALLYYRRRSLQLDMDVVFPAFWRVRDGDSHLTVLGPLVHRQAPGAHDNWVAPLFFEGARPDGGYFHAPLLLTTSHWNQAGAFTLVGPYFRARSAASVDTGLAPIFFHGDNGDVQGNRRSYTLIPPLLFYHQTRETYGSATTVIGPIVVQSDPKRDVFDVAPLFFHIRGRPATGGIAEEHTTLLPLFHYGHDGENSLFILPGYYRRVTRTSDTLLTPFYSRATGRGGATTLTAAGPIIPLWWDYRDRDIDAHTWALAPLFFSSDSPSGHDWLTPLVGRFETYGESKTWWFFPTLTVSSGVGGWENDFHPLVYVGRNADATHTVIAPFFWDFGTSKGRTTVGFPLYWRVADHEDASVTQVAGNTLYMQKRVAGGLDWQFHFLPLFSYGESPGGYFWNVLFGLAGYSRDGAQASVRALWVPIDVGGKAPPNQTASGR